MTTAYSGAGASPLLVNVQSLTRTSNKGTKVKRNSNIDLSMHEALSTVIPAMVQHLRFSITLQHLSHRLIGFPDFSGASG